MIDKKAEKGITLIILIIMIIMMLILVSVSVSTGLKTYKNAKVTKFVMQMQLIQKKVDVICQEYKDQEIKNELDDFDFPGIRPNGTGFPTNEIITIMGETEYNRDSFYIRYLDEEALNVLELKDITDRIIVNFATREVFSLNGVEDETGQIHYTQYDLPGRTKNYRIYSSNNKFR